ncbi:MAG: asparagine synthase (glutamine-hydrolyzing) [Dechloromonas sp.]|uniref:asparagine synthase (glutamine-hydrolyzing) n=1 Tax=Dechloromonas sp. TaxID=1917218 RepID=UPI0027FB929A|nr:asparagine synthase (glutamine-hydrolyzing) [Dechloromonas sp.]MBT9519359.1 asparagine synthase (glutamine-hydrolyzing) [Dechloromonas sp.]
MCGIAGLIDWGASFGKDKLAEITLEMRDSMIHRGPDDAGIWGNDSGSCALAHRRLSIIDLSADGKQPMCNEDGTIWVTFNGEIYNFQQLRAKLIAEGHCFHSHADTEVLPHLFEKMEPARLKSLDGMFAFAAWNERDKRLLLARDPFGKKPLYFSEGPGWFAFASELKALRSVPQFDSSLDREALSLYLLLQYVPAPLTIFSGARKLPPGHYLEADFSNEGAPKVRVVQYSQFSPSEPNTKPDRVTEVDQLGRIVIDAVEKRLVSDVPLGAFLSGGVDSSLVAAVATKELGRNLKTFTIGFEGSSDSEHIAAREIAEHLGTDHYERILKPDAIALVDEIASRLDEPNGDSSCLPMLLLCQHAREHVTVALSGDGGDEMFGGYGRYRDTLNEEGNWPRRMLRKVGMGDGWSASSAYLSPRWLIFQPEQVSKLVRGMPDSVNHTLLEWTEILEDSRLPVLHRMRKLDALTYMPGAVLAKVDRMSMQVSLEVRCPLLDSKLARFAENLSVDSCWRPPSETKRILKHLASRYLPEEWMNRRKLGFGLPANAWSKDEVISLTKELLLGSNSKLRDYVDANVLEGMVAKQAESNCFSIYQVWPLLILEAWLRKNTS